MGTHQIVYILAMGCMILGIIFARMKKMLPLWITTYVFEGIFLFLAADCVIYYNALPGLTLGEYMSALGALVVYIILTVVTLISHVCNVIIKKSQE